MELLTVDAGKVFPDESNPRSDFGEEACEQMSLERLYAVAEFADEPGTVDRLLGCAESEWERQAALARADREARERVEAMRETAAAIGARMTDEEKEDPRDAGYRYDYRVSLRTPKDLEDAFAEDPERWFTWIKRPGSSHAHFYAYAPERDEGAAPDPAEEERQRAAAELAASFKCAFDEMRAWFAGRALRVGMGTLPHLRDLCIDGFKEAVDYDELLEDFPALEGVDGYSRHDMAIGYAQRVPWRECSQPKALAILGDGNDWYTHDLCEMEDAFLAFEADGFRFEGDAAAARRAVAEFVAAGGEEGGDEAGADADADAAGQ